MPWYMQWWVWGIVGGVITPWILFPKSMRAGFEVGAQQGFGAWSGACWITVPVMLGLMYVAHILTP
jgi:hypothetical protein